jgi:uncharacterized membrane protein
MNLKTYNKTRMAIAAVLGGLVSFSVVSENYVLPMIATVTALILVLALRRRVSEVISDERDYHIAGKAARWTISVYAILAGLGSIVLMAFRKTDPSLELLGSILAYSACFVMLLQSALFYFFAKKDHGEK